MGCAMGTVRYILFFFNFLLALAGLGILVLGIAKAHSDGATINNVLHGQLSTPAIAFAVVGGCVFIFAFFGCCGALRESHCMIATYAVLLLTLFLLQVAVAVLAYTYRGQAQEAISSSVEDVFMNYKNNNHTQEAVDEIQSSYHCCGSKDTNTPWETLNISAPKSCLDKDTQHMYETACIPKLTDMVKDGLTIIGQVAITVGVIELLGIIFSLCLANSIRRSELRGYA